ncbi:MAG: hypothetical protein Q4A82_05245 [Corynebacterium sp.]|nr:hypothetical protein [Corynebacterium sp.]
MMRDRKMICLVSFLFIIVFGVVSATIYHFWAERPWFVLVHRAMIDYQKVVDAEWGDPSCTLENCSKSSKSIPGVPSTRAQLTEAERFNLKLRGNVDSLSTIHMRSDIAFHHVTKNDDGSVTAIVYVYTAREYRDGDVITGGPYVYQAELMPIDGGYVVMANKPVDETGQFHPHTFYLINSLG